MAAISGELLRNQLPLRKQLSSGLWFFRAFFLCDLVETQTGYLCLRGNQGCDNLKAISNAPVSCSAWMFVWNTPELWNYWPVERDLFAIRFFVPHDIKHCVWYDFSGTETLLSRQVSSHLQNITRHKQGWARSYSCCLAAANTDLQFWFWNLSVCSFCARRNRENKTDMKSRLPTSTSDFSHYQVRFFSTPM